MKRGIATLIILLISTANYDLFAGKNSKKKYRKKNNLAEQVETICVNNTLQIPVITICQEPKDKLSEAFLGLYAQLSLLNPVKNDMEKPLCHLELVYNALVAKNNNNAEKTKSELCGHADNIANEISYFKTFISFDNDLEKIINENLISGFFTSTSPWKQYIYEIMKKKTQIMETCDSEIVAHEAELQQLKERIDFVSKQIERYQQAKDIHTQGFNTLMNYSSELVSLLEEDIKDCEGIIDSEAVRKVEFEDLLSSLRKNDTQSETFEQERATYLKGIAKSQQEIKKAEALKITVTQGIRHLETFMKKADKPGSVARYAGLV